MLILLFFISFSKHLLWPSVVQDYSLLLYMVTLPVVVLVFPFVTRSLSPIYLHWFHLKHILCLCGLLNFIGGNVVINYGISKLTVLLFFYRLKVLGMFHHAYGNYMVGNIYSLPYLQEYKRCVNFCLYNPSCM